MRINNINVTGNGANLLFQNDFVFPLLYRSVPRINRIFKFNAMVLLDCVSSSRVTIGNNIHPDVAAAAANQTIFIFSDRVEPVNLDKLILHEYVHVCIASTFCCSCPLWLNEGLAVYLSEQEVEPVCPKDVNQLFLSDQSVPEFYNMSLYTVQRMVDIMTLQQLVDAARACRSFSVSSVFGEEAVGKILRI